MCPETYPFCYDALVGGDRNCYEGASSYNWSRVSCVGECARDYYDPTAASSEIIEADKYSFEPIGTNECRTSIGSRPPNKYQWANCTSCAERCDQLYAGLYHCAGISCNQFRCVVYWGEREIQATATGITGVFNSMTCYKASIRRHPPSPPSPAYPRSEGRRAG